MTDTPAQSLEERIARVIDPFSFRSWEGMKAYCLKTGDDEETATRYADQTYRANMDSAEAKAAEICALLPKPGPAGEVGGPGWQKRQAAVCPCRGADEYCPCQNVDEPWKYGLGSKPASPPTAVEETVARLRALLTPESPMHPIGYATWQAEADAWVEEAADALAAQAAEIERLKHDNSEWKARWNHHKGKADQAKLTRNRAINGLEHWKALVASAEASAADARAALQPFAQWLAMFGNGYLSQRPDDEQAVALSLTLGHFRRAAEAYAALQSGTGVEG